MKLDPIILDVFDNRPVLVTGAAGFIGSHLTDTLVTLRANTHIFLRASSRGPQNLSPKTLKAATVHWGNLVDPFSVRKILKDFYESAKDKPIIFHLAAQAHVGESWHRPVETFMNNTLGTLHLLQAIVDLEIDLYKLDLAGTSEEFGNISEDLRDNYRFREDGMVIFDERSPVNPQSPYGTSKTAAGFLGKNYYQAYDVPVVRTRMFNNFGPRQSPRYFTGTVITQALHRDNIVMGHSDTTRDYTYVLDGVRGHLYAAALGREGDVYAYGFGDDITNSEWANLIIEIGKEMGAWGNKSITIDPSRFRPGSSEIKRLGVDYSTFRKETGWKPEYGREDAIRETISYYKDNVAHWWGMQDW